MKRKHKKNKSMAFITGMLCLVLLLVVLLAIVPIMEVSHEQLNTTSTFDWAGIDELTVTSENLQNGVWDDSIANTERGKNLSPQLSWERAENAQAYVIYMIDPDGNNWIHLISGTLTKEEVVQGEITQVNKGTSDTGYIGPYPPAGTHSYEVYVFALKQAKTDYAGKVNAVCDGIDKIAQELDADAAGASGNIAAYGKLTGTYTK
jgi:cold-shock domain protein